MIYSVNADEVVDVTRIACEREVYYHVASSRAIKVSPLVNIFGGEVVRYGPNDVETEEALDELLR